MPDKKNSYGMILAIFLVSLAVLMAVLLYQKGRRSEPTGGVATQAERLSPAAEKIKLEHPDWSNDICNAVAEKKIVWGMTGEQVIVVRGKPFKINTGMNAYQTREEWVMEDNPDSSRLYFDNGVVIAIQDAPGR